MSKNNGKYPGQPARKILFLYGRGNWDGLGRPVPKKLLASEVLNLATGEILTYDLSPEKAVKAAYLQFTVKDFNTWDYEKRQAPLVFGKYSVSCGDFSALIEKIPVAIGNL